MCEKDGDKELIRIGVPEVLEFWNIKHSSLEIIKTGLINLTIKISSQSGEFFVLQRVNKRFSSDVTRKISALTPHLESYGLKTPHVVPSKNGRITESHKKHEWRILTFIEGMTYDKIQTSYQASEVGKFLAKFHLALDDFQWRKNQSGDSIHGLDKHLERLKKGLAKNNKHAAHREALKIAHTIFDLHDDLPRLEYGENKMLHGDPKINNFLFSADDGRAVCLLDLDTVGWMWLAWELGDAFRSWCNPGGEDCSSGSFDASLFKAAYEGYAAEAKDYFNQEDRESVVMATLYIYLELAARFLLDALEEHYFAWNDEIFSSAVEHNLVRAKGQLAAGFDLFNQLNDLRGHIARL